MKYYLMERLLTYVLLSSHGESNGTNDYQWGLVIPRKNFQEKMNGMFRGFDFIQV